MSTRYGTSHFASRDSAVRYYASQGDTRADAALAVAAKLRDKEIAIGRPDCPPNCEVILDPVEGRYFIQEVPRARAFERALAVQLEIWFPWLGTDDDAGSGADIIAQICDIHADLIRDDDEVSQA